jgi:hypothetical protein
MAWVYFRGRISYHDARGNKGSKEVEMRVDDVTFGTPEEQYAEAANQLGIHAAALDNVIDPMIDEITLTSLIPHTGLSLKTSPGVREVSSGAQLQLSTEDFEGQLHERPYFLPGAKDGIFLANLETVDTGDTDLLAFVATFNAADTIEITVSDKEEVLSVVSGYWASKRRSSNA